MQQQRQELMESGQWYMIQIRIPTKRSYKMETKFRAKSYKN